MQSDDVSVYRSGDLRVEPALGRVAYAGGASARLGPVNMKVLVALLGRRGEVVSRAELYESVWGNQVVGEDALTRCISDIRSQLRDLSGRADWIETVPKRGYRWCGREPADSGTGARTRLLSWAWRGTAYLMALVVMASLVTWLVDRWTAPGSPVVAVLPVVTDEPESALADRLELELTAWLMGIDRVRVLARSAVATRPANPFPFFYYEFGARWLVESEIRHVGKETRLTVALVDSRTGIVELQVSELVDAAESDLLPGAGEALPALRRYIEAELDPSR